MRPNKSHLASAVITLVTVAAVVWFAASHSDSFLNAMKGVSVTDALILLTGQVAYVILNAEIWYDAMKEAEPEITRFDIYSSYGVSSFFWPMSALFGAAAQIWALKRIAPASHVGHAISSLAPVIWVKGMVASFGIALFFGTRSPVNAGVAVIVLVVVGVGLAVVEKMTRGRDFLHGLTVIRKPKRMLVIVVLVVGVFAVQILRLAIALDASGIDTGMFPVMSVVIGQGFAGVMPILAGAGSAAVAFSSEQADAAAAVIVCTGTAFIAGAAVSIASVIARKRGRECSEA